MKPGQRYRLAPGGPVYTVLRVNQCAAYLYRGVQKTVTKTCLKTGELKSFEVTGREVISISAQAFLYPGSGEEKS